MEDRNRTRNIHKNFYFSEEEAELLAFQAEANGMSESEFVRMLLSGQGSIDDNRFSKDNGKLVIDFSNKISLVELAQELRAVAAILSEAATTPDDVEEASITFFERVNHPISPRIVYDDGSYMNLITSQSYEDGMTIFDINPKLIRKESDYEES